MKYFNSFLALFRNRRLQVDISTIFLSLIFISFVSVICVTYFKTSKSISVFAKQIVELASSGVEEKLGGLISNAQIIPEITRDILIKHSSGFSLESKELVSFLLSVVNYQPDFSAAFLGRGQGAIIGSCNLEHFGVTHYFSNPSKELPPGSVFGVFLKKDASPSTPFEWEYRNAQLEIVGKDFQESDFNTRESPWYKGAIQTDGAYWTDPYGYFTSDVRGITVSQALYNAEEKLTGIIGISISLESLCDFMLAQKIGNTGFSRILDNAGKTLITGIPDTSLGGKESLKRDELITLAYQQFVKNQENNFLFESEGIRYLAHLKKRSINDQTEWIVAIIVPINDFFSGLFEAQKSIAYITVLILFISGLITVFYSRKISNPIVLLTKEINSIEKLELDSTMRVKSSIKEVVQLDSSIAAMRLALISFSRYLPKAIIKQLFQKEQDIVLGGEKKELTIFFSDIQDFTPIAERLPIELLMSELAIYFDSLSKVILKFNGTIDKYIGDSVMAFWGAPLDMENHASQACLAALYCRKTLDQFNQKQREFGNPEFKTSMGLNTGTVIVGNIGTTDRMNYTVIGDAVNVAARLQKVNKEYHVDIIISDELRQQLGSEFLVRPLDIVLVKGKSEKIKIYELVALVTLETAVRDAGILATGEQLELCALFTEAYEVYAQGDFKRAKDLFESILKKNPQDFPTQMYLDRINNRLLA